ncbi:MAG: ABC transporter ATP-binding protein, partial [Prevotellaceae bacterium]|nr:ABC transporter ATP-binding protein [Prevotellaceae bacterium]
MNNNDYLILKELSIGFNKVQKPLYSPISATLLRGNLIALFGRNGIGKSTLLKTIMGLQPPKSGEVILCGEDISRWTPAQIATHLAFVPSNPIRAHRLSVADMVGTGRHRFTNIFGSEQKRDKESIHQALEATKLTHLALRDSSTLSDGEMQRASISRSLVQETPIILLDEPTAFLDLGNKYQIIQLLKQLTRTNNKAILFSTHDLAMALQVCDLIWIMD